MITGLRRSAIYIPCDSENMLAKSAGFAADLLLLNLEDGIAASKKDLARINAVNALKSLDFGVRETVVRVNSPASEAGQLDLAAIVPCRPDGICLPKIETPMDIQSADRAILALENSAGLAPGVLRLHAMIESASGVLAARDIAASSRRMASIIFGSADYCEDVHCLQGEDRIELLLALQMIVTGARAASIDAIDAPCFDIRNPEPLRREAIQARRLGFDGKSVLHPGQLAVINEVFDVTPEELEWAGKVLAELVDAEDRGRALSTLDGRLIDNPHRKAAERILQRARLAQQREGI
jgi:citrate lyase subunit beta/citryl-CoA lyase